MFAIGGHGDREMDRGNYGALGSTKGRTEPLEGLAGRSEVESGGKPFNDWGAFGS
jgi:hypothetical protein